MHIGIANSAHFADFKYAWYIYQLDLTTPGRRPSSASRRKQIRHSWKRRMYPRGRPQILQRLRTRTGYLRRFSRQSIHFL